MIPLIDNLRCKTFPLATLLIIALNCLMFVVEIVKISSGQGDAFFHTWLMVPNDVVTAFTSGHPAAIGMAVLTVFASMFLHGGLMHIVGNMLFLFVFGRAMEARMGRGRFVAFYLIGGIFAAVAQIWIDPTSTGGTLGASGAIAGVLGGYLLLWPKAKVKGLLMPIFMPIEARAYWFLLFWFGMQLYSIMHGANDGVAYAAHVGGFVSGMLMALLLRWREPVSDVCYIPTACAPCEKDKHTHDE